MKIAIFTTIKEILKTLMTEVYNLAPPIMATMLELERKPFQVI